MARRRLRWLGHVRRMDWSRLPRKLLSSWVYQARPLGRPRKRWAESIEYDIKTAGLTFSNWHAKANEENKLEWKNRIKKLGEPRKKLSGMTKKKRKEKTGELGNLISEVVKFSVKICSKIRQFSFSL